MKRIFSESQKKRIVDSQISLLKQDLFSEIRKTIKKLNGEIEKLVNEIEK